MHYGVISKMIHFKRPLTILCGLAVIGICHADEKVNNNNPIPPLEWVFQEPNYPKNINPLLLKELAWFFGGDGDFNKKKTKQNWNDLLMRIRQAGLPRFAKKEDFNVTNDTITNISSEPVLVIFGHEASIILSPYKKSYYYIGAYRTHLLPAKSSIENKSGFGYDLLWCYPDDTLLDKSFTPPKFFKLKKDNKSQ